MCILKKLTFERNVVKRNTTFTSDGYYKVEGFDNAIIGVSESIEPKIVYDKDKLIEILVTVDKMKEEDAVDYIYHSVAPLEQIIVVDSSENELIDILFTNRLNK